MPPPPARAQTAQALPPPSPPEPCPAASQPNQDASPDHATNNDAPTKPPAPQESPQKNHASEADVSLASAQEPQRLTFSALAARAQKTSSQRPKPSEPHQPDHPGQAEALSPPGSSQNASRQAHPETQRPHRPIEPKSASQPPYYKSARVIQNRRCNTQQCTPRNTPEKIPTLMGKRERRGMEAFPRSRVFGGRVGVGRCGRGWGGVRDP